MDGIYDANGYPLDERVVENTVPVSAGETYYMHLTNTTNQDVVAQICSFEDGYTMDDYLKSINTPLSSLEDENRLVRKQVGVEKHFEGDSNSVWDIYELSFDFKDIDYKFLKNRYAWFWSSFATVTPYKVHFGKGIFDFDLEEDNSWATACINTSTLIGSFDSVAIPKGLFKNGQTDVTHICSDGAIHGNATFSCDIYLPSGKKLVSKDMVYWDSEYVSNKEVSKTSINISASSVSRVKKSYTYSGKALTPLPVITYTGKKLVKDKDYKLSYSSNKNVGTGKLLITGKGDYTGTKSISFKIVKATNPLKIKVSSKSFRQKKLTRASSFSIGASKGKGNVSYTLNAAAKKAKIKVSAKGKVTIPKKCKKGTYKITVRAKGDSNYKEISKTVKVVVK